MIKNKAVYFSILFFFSFFNATVSSASNKVIRTIGFGSCVKQNKSQKLFRTIAKNSLDLWIWTGDVVYADTTSPQVLRKKYRRQMDNSFYQKFVGLGFPIIGTWDDHDYGQNDAGKENPIKKEAQQAFLDFLGVPKNSPRRSRQGVYHSHLFGPPGKQIKILVLDTRYHREQPGPRSDILGEKQWQWLAKELQNNRAQLTLIVTSIQFVADDHVVEKWGNFPRAKRRLLQLLHQKRTKNFLFISGDRHRAELSKLRQSDSPFSFPVYDITSSGITHYTKKFLDEVNTQRVGKPILKRKHFGLLKIDWRKHEIRVWMEIRGKKNKLYLSHPVSFLL